MLNLKNIEPRSKPVKEETLWEAAAKGNTERITKYIENKGALGEVDGNKMSLLHHAAWGGQLDIVKMLCEGCNVDAQDREGWTPLQTAVDKGHVEVAIFLCTEGGADPTMKDSYKRNSLHIACMQNMPTLVTALKKEGLTNTAKTMTGYTPLHYAGSLGFLDCCKSLEPTSAHAAIKASGKTALDLALEGNHTETAEYLRTLS
eukprot:TRINITY_DN3868_c1_g1_i1.p1 TRINITY_DN3868_c1_g1~~TRINITY_DN3868_c1_g1_i1.p1  ORF type:complete len:216 (+),score=59.19 TRINITY_DN3868_c1_g1_i1:42-650(+)